MKKLSYWAASNPWKARIMIAVSHLFILFLGWYTGTALNAMNITIPGALLFLFIAYYLVSVFMYPAKEDKKKLGSYKFYIRQKICDFSLAASAWLMIICIANNKKVQTGFFNLASAASVENTVATEKPTAAQILESLKYRDKSSLTKEEKRILKKEFSIQLKKYTLAKFNGDKAAQSNAGAVILAIVLALGLLYLVGAAACSLSCNGNDAAAILVGLFGTAAIIIGLIFFIKGLQKKQNSEKLKSKEE